MTIFSFRPKGVSRFNFTLGAARMDAPPKPSLDDPGVETWAPWDDAALEDGNRLGRSPISAEMCRDSQI